jgi:hypothetical protein
LLHFNISFWYRCANILDVYIYIYIYIYLKSPVFSIPMTLKLVISFYQRMLLNFSKIRTQKMEDPVAKHLCQKNHCISFVFALFLSSSCVLCAQCCQCLWIVHSWLNPSGFSNVYLMLKMNQRNLIYFTKAQHRNQRSWTIRTQQKITGELRCSRWVRSSFLLDTCSGTHIYMYCSLSRLSYAWILKYIQLSTMLIYFNVYTT